MNKPSTQAQLEEALMSVLIAHTLLSTDAIDERIPKIISLLHSPQEKPQEPVKPTAADNVQPALRAVRMGLFPTMASLQSVIDLANSQLPITTPNAILGLLMIYHNTLLEQVASCKP